MQVVVMLDVRCLLCFKAPIANPGWVAAGVGDKCTTQAVAGKAKPR